MAKKNDKATIAEKLTRAIIPTDEAPYAIPANWCWTRLGEVISLHRGVTYHKTDVRSLKTDRNCLILRGGNIEEGHIDYNASDNVYVDKKLVNDNQYLQRGDVIIVASTGSKNVIGRAGISFNDCNDVAFGAFLLLARANNKLNRYYVDYFFQSIIYRQTVRRLAGGVNINNIRSEHINNIPIPLPPLAEQERIVAQIESLFTKLDEAKDKIRNALGSFANRKSAILHQAFQGELTKKWRAENGVSLAEKVNEPVIPESEQPYPLPSTWRWLYWGSCGKFVAGSGFGKSFQGQLDKDIPFYKVGSLKYSDANGVLYDTANTIDEATRKKLKADLIPINSIIFAKIGEAIRLNRRSLNAVACCIDNNLMSFQTSNADYKYIFYWTLSLDLYSYTNATTVPAIRKSDLERIAIPLPPLAEQKEIVRLLDNILEKEKTAEELSRLIDQIDLIKKTILAKAFRGKLGTNNPHDPNAQELLKDVLSG